MQEFQVTCVTKPNRVSTHEHITHIGNNETQWCLSRESVIRRIDTKSEAFFTIDPSTGKKSYIGVVRESTGKAPYLRCYADKQWNNNLLSLSECDTACELKG